MTHNLVDDFLRDYGDPMVTILVIVEAGDSTLKLIQRVRLEWNYRSWALASPVGRVQMSGFVVCNASGHKRKSGENH